MTPAPGPSTIAPKPRWGSIGPGPRPFPSVALADFAIVAVRCSRCRYAGYRRGGDALGGEACPRCGRVGTLKVQGHAGR